MDIVSPTDAPLEHLITPHFMHLNLVNQVQSTIQRRIITDVKEVVQLRFAGDKNFAPVFGVNEVYKTDGINAITYAERFATQYKQFLAGDAQLADGTPLEKLIEEGMTPAYISLCRALKIHSVEALAALEGPNLKASGAVVANTLKPMAQRYLEGRAGGAAMMRELEALRAEIAAMKSGSIVVPKEPVPDEQVEAMISEADDMEALRQKYTEVTGSKPHHNMKAETLRSMILEAGGTI